MNQVADNPYVAPEAELEVQHEAGDLSVFPRFTTWAVFGLTIITLGIYAVYWMYSRTRHLNSITEDRISNGFVGAAVGVYIASGVSSIMMGLTDASALSGTMVLIDGLLGLASWILMLVWAFKFRNRLNRVTDSRGKPTWAGPILTFFFSVFYLSYKVNQHLDIRASR
ncbi:DUF4234 domain-containing protein [Marinobacterium weihaiense]|uniref:DUF4234 domain-containing protein n=1 Tax=Marinobacterium weihaiense TaxID=2851016 RepID=A0ABS6M7R4_9GAMM|nr:DUF4234 domain-containing protein [Marinobacterium weihaiense]MBV0932332.1 DUF4234 domain-containing protein [Marinobacterium weihaiense]